MILSRSDKNHLHEPLTFLYSGHFGGGVWPEEANSKKFIFSGTSITDIVVYRCEKCWQEGAKGVRFFVGTAQGLISPESRIRKN